MVRLFMLFSPHLLAYEIPVWSLTKSWDLCINCIGTLIILADSNTRRIKLSCRRRGAKSSPQLQDLILFCVSSHLGTEDSWATRTRPLQGVLGKLRMFCAPTPLWSSYFSLLGTPSSFSFHYLSHIITWTPESGTPALPTSKEHAREKLQITHTSWYSREEVKTEGYVWNRGSWFGCKPTL